MQRYSLAHLSNEVLRKELSNKAAKEKEATAELIAHISEFDARRLYLPAAYPSMLSYCVGQLGLSKEAAAKRIFVARAGRRCPEVFEALADGRVHLSGLVLLAKYLEPTTAGELLAAAACKAKAEIEQLIAERFPRPNMPARVEVIPTMAFALATAEHSLGNVANADSQPLAGAHPHAHVAPLSAQAYAVRFTRSRDADERFRYLQDLLGHQVARADIAEVYDRAVRELIKKMEHVRFGACVRPRTAGGGSSDDPRHIAAQVKRDVWKRDGGQCTFVSESGHRCEARGDVEFDHKKEVARGGESTPDNLRLRCRGHNQHAAEQTFGAGFMKAKREEVRAASARRAERAQEMARRKAESKLQAQESRLLPHELEVIPWLRQLGCREDESRIAARRCREMADAPLEDRVKRALSWFGARIARTVTPVAASAPRTDAAQSPQRNTVERSGERCHGPAWG